MKDRETVHALWIKGPLSALEWLTIHSFIRHGYQFKLWTYDVEGLQLELPHLNIADARHIIPDQEVFSYDYCSPLGMGKGSFAGFSDIFRYKLLYELGGWWTDMDVTCLSKPDISEPYLFRLSIAGSSKIVGNIMKVPAHSELMRNCYERAKKLDAQNRDWEAPINILNEEIIRLDLGKYAHLITNDDSWPTVSKLMRRSTQDLSKWHFIHWMNEEFRILKISKASFPEAGHLGQMTQEYGLGRVDMSAKEIASFNWKTSLPYYFLMHAKNGSLPAVMAMAFHFLSRKLRH